MAIPLDGAEGLFTRLGWVGNLFSRFHAFQDDVRATFEGLYDEYPDDYKLLGNMPQLEDSAMRQQQAMLSGAAQVAQTTLIEMAVADVPTLTPTVGACLAEVIRQMEDGTETVARQTCTVTPTALSTNTGDGVFNYTLVRPDGQPCELVVAETAAVRCTGDAQSNTATEGSEPFRFTGEPNGSTAYDYDWPAGSGAQLNFTAVDATVTDLLTNGGFDDWTSGTPDSWTTSGVTEDASGYVGSAAIFATTGNPSAYQAVDLLPQSAYAWNCWIKRTGVMSAGVMTVELVDGSNTVIADEAGTNNQTNTSYTSIGASYASLKGWFRTPKVLPSEIRVRIRASTTLAGATVCVDHFSLARPTAYPGGYGFAVHSGATPFILGDGWDVAATNDRASATNGATWQTLMDRLFGMAALGLQLPSTAGSETILDTLITSP